jgi:hypothetical protein
MRNDLLVNKERWNNVRERERENGGKKEGREKLKMYAYQ